MIKKELDLVVVLTTRNGNGSITFSCLTEIAGWVQNTYYGYGMRQAKAIFKNRIMDDLYAGRIFGKNGALAHTIEGVKKLNKEMRQSFIIGLVIIGIEFSMNVSYFMQEMGGDLGGMFLSAVAALVPTALLIAETFMLSQTKFDIYACEELVAKTDRE